jgi:uncharacterized protein (TIGR03437 family)
MQLAGWNEFKRPYAVLLPMLLCFAAGPVLAQTTIGGGACTSSTLTGTYEFLMSGRQVTTAGTVSKLFQAVGTANFDGLSKVTLTLTANTVTATQAFGTPLVYSGTYSLQSNCVGSINITNGDSATFTVEAYNQGKAFAVIGSDTNYAYNGSGNAQPDTCPTTISGIHEFSGTGNTLSGTSVTGVLDVAGVLQFDGQGNLTANWTQVSNLAATTITATGTYSLNSMCMISAALTDSAGNKYALSVSVYGTSPSFAIAVTTPQMVFDGSGAAAQTTTTTGCAVSSLTGPYEFTLSGRLAPNGITSRLQLADGAATFDGLGKVTISLTSNTVNGSQVFGTPLVYSGTYTLASNCQGTISITSGDIASMSLVAYSVDATTLQAKSFTVVGTDASYALNGSGTVQPAACAVSTLSGEFPFSGTGNALSGSAITGVADIAGEVQFDGQGNATANWTVASNTSTTNVTASGTYTVTPACLGSLTLTDGSNNKYTGAVSVFGALAANFEWVATNPLLAFTVAGRAAFVNPGQAVVNAASFNADNTPAGSVFTIFGSSLATKEAQATSTPLPTALLTTSVTVNGEPAPLFYADPGQINAQMPEDIKPGVATVIVKDGSSTSNAVAVMVPSVGTPGISMYGNNMAVVVNSDGGVNGPSSEAKVGDTVVVYFTGGGPVNASGTLASGAPSPAGLSPVSGANSITVDGVAATTVNYVGLTPGSIGLYQANFVIPKVAAGGHAIVITISGQASNNPLIYISN